MVWDDLVADCSAAVRGDDDVVLKTYSAEVAVGIESVVVDEVLVHALALPEVDEVRDEVDARLYSHDEAFLHAASAAETVEAKLCGWLHFLVKTYVVLTEAFHVVDIHTHHVAQSVRHEHGVRSSLHSFICVALHESDGFQVISDDAASSEVHVEPFYSRLSILNDPVVRLFHSEVYLSLLLSEAS